MLVPKPFVMICYSVATKKVSTIIRSNRVALTGFPKVNYLDPYENAIGFTHGSRIGSSKFNCGFGSIMEDIYDTSEHFTKFNKENKKFKTGCDGFNNTTYFECKSRWNTMKASMASKEITDKLTISIRDDKNFKLLILNDKENFYKNGRCIPLHEGHSLNEIQHVPGYDPQRHKWVSGEMIYKLLWPEEFSDIEKTILEELHYLSGCL